MARFCSVPLAEIGDILVHLGKGASPRAYPIHDQDGLVVPDPSPRCSRSLGGKADEAHDPPGGAVHIGATSMEMVEVLSPACGVAVEEPMVHGGCPPDGGDPFPSLVT